MKQNATFLALCLTVVVAMNPGVASGQEETQKKDLKALAGITGQWGGSLDGLRWRRSVHSALNDKRPLMVLQLFGRLDEEFC